MAELLRVEPTRSHLTGEPDGNAWFVFDDGRSYHRPLERVIPPARSSPFIHRDSIEPCLGADGRMHDSLASYRRSLRADGNPRGETFIELGNERMTPNLPTFDRKQRRDDIRAGIEDVRNGRVPPLAILED